ncbi:MAG TPA: TMEM175 family protein [Pseudonocardiaceae bacterium]|jgi:uncharacterized membrane protein|nr:TMEM175 family protein [Pseudonocardiaceae bacterium]
MNNSWWGGSTSRGDAARLEAFSDGVLAIAITLLILNVHVETGPGHRTLASALAAAGPEIVAYMASFLQIGIMWANHHALFRVVAKVDHVLLLFNLLLLGFVTFLPLPTQLVAEHHANDGDGRLAMAIYGLTLVGSAVSFNLIWRYARRRGLLTDSVSPEFCRDVDVRYLAGLCGYVFATALAFVLPWLTLLVTAVLALLFLLGPSPRAAIADEELIEES